MKEGDNVAEAKKSLKHHIKFLKSLEDHIKFGDPVFKSRAMFATWCLHRYINDQLVNDIEKAMKENGGKSD
jgi:hypothetical protein